MTTNHIDRLDKAMIRPGRIDYVEYIGDATDYQIRNLFQNFFEKDQVPASEAEKFLQILRNHLSKVSMAALQGYLLRHKGNPQQALEDIHILVKDLESRQKDPHKLEQTAGSLPGVLKKAKEVKPRPVKPLTAEQVDKMYFNPQEGWDKDL
jgi:SpoVK/Ycf46/Vps4 family AAA+-type ATPase